MLLTAGYWQPKFWPCCYWMNDYWLEYQLDNFIVQLTTYIADNTSFTLNTDIFVGADIVDAPIGSAVVMESPGGTINYSGVIMNQPIQILVRDEDYVSTENKIMSIHNLIAEKPGFSGVSNVYYCETLSFPQVVERSALGEVIMTSNYIFRRR